MQNATTVYKVSGKTHIANFSVIATIKTLHLSTLSNVIGLGLRLGFWLGCTSADQLCFIRVLHSAFCFLI